MQRLEADLALYPKLQAAAEALGKSQRALVDAEAKVLADKAAYEQALADKEAYENNLAALGNAQAQRAVLESQLKEAQQRVAELKKLQATVAGAKEKLALYEANKQTEQQAETVKNACLKAYDNAQQE